METNLIRELNSVLKLFPEFWQGETLLRSKVIDALKAKEPKLIKALIGSEKIKQNYSTDIDGVLIFDFDKLIGLLRFKEYWPDSFTKYRNKIGLTSDGKYLDYDTDVVLSFPFKDCVLEGGMTKEEQGRDEVYYNEIIARDEIDRLFSPKVFTNTKRYSKDRVEENITEFKDDDNLIIKGNNLIALHSLKQRFAGKIKLIYIDPPYNTDNDSFKYNDRFSRSTWLVFMKNRLEIAKELLSDSGLIFVHIGDGELHYLKILMDGIFDEKKFIATIPRKTRNGKSDVPYKLSQDYDWILVYTNSYCKKDFLFKRKVQRKYYESSDYPGEKWRLSDLTTQRTIKERPNSNFTLINPRDKAAYQVNPERSWAVTKDTVKEFLSKGKIVFPGDYDFLSIKTPAMRTFLSEDLRDKGEDFDSAYVSSEFLNLATDEFLKSLQNKRGNDELIELFGNKKFSYPKPEALIKKIVEYCTDVKDIVLDFHLGSGTTAAVAHKMGRRYIGIEQMDYINDITVPRLQKVVDGEQGGISKDVKWQGGGSFVYTELKQLNGAFIDAIDAASGYEELAVLFEKMKATAHLNYQVELDNVLTAEYEVDGIDHKLGFKDLSLDEQKRLLIELLDKNQLYVNVSEMDDATLDISENDKTFTKSFYGEVL